MLDRFALFGSNRTMKSRSERRAQGTLGVVMRDGKLIDEGIFRDPKLERLDAYYESRQYANLVAWEEGACAEPPVPIRKRQPRLIIPFSKTLAQRVTAKLVGDSVFPELMVYDSPDDQEFFQAVVRESEMKTFLLEPTRRMLNTGEVFVRFWIEAGVYRKKWYNAKYCYPKFQPNGELELVTIKYVYDDHDDKDENGKPIKKWYKLELGTDSEVLYDNPEYEPGVTPEFVETGRVDHGLGFVQGEWMTTTGEEKGYGLTEDITSFIDELNYSLSQSSTAVSYNQDPQLYFKNLTEEETAAVIRSAMKSWNLGRDGEAGFLESNLNGVSTAMDLRDKMRLNVQDITRIVLLDPDKIVGQATSAKAMEVLHGPLKDLIDEIRGPIGKTIRKLTIKMGIAAIMGEKQGIQSPIILPPGYQPMNMNIELDWPPMFQQTIEDLQKKVAVAVQAAGASIISRRTALEYLAKDFGVVDLDEEQAKIDAQPVINPFGAF